MNFLKKHFKITSAIVLIIFINAVGCVPYKKTILLREKGSRFKDTIPTSLNYYKLQKNDIISIQVSSFNKQVSEFYNLKEDAGIGGFLVKQNGYVNIPMMDSIYVQGLSIPEVEKMVSSSLSEQLKEPYVVVRLVNFKLVFLGEVGAPGVVTVKDNSINIFEGLALAGNISELGNNTDVKLVRKLDENHNFIVKLDLTSKDIINSPYFYLQPNDVIYIEPLRVKTFRGNFQTVASFLSLSTFVVVMSNFIINLTR